MTHRTGTFRFFLLILFFATITYGDDRAKLRELKDLLDEGLITEKVYEEAASKILERDATEGDIVPKDNKTVGLEAKIHKQLDLLNGMSEQWEFSLAESTIVIKERDVDQWYQFQDTCLPFPEDNRAEIKVFPKEGLLSRKPRRTGIYIEGPSLHIRNNRYAAYQVKYLENYGPMLERADKDSEKLKAFEKGLNDLFELYRENLPEVLEWRERIASSGATIELTFGSRSKTILTAEKENTSLKRASKTPIAWRAKVVNFK